MGRTVPTDAEQVISALVPASLSRATPAAVLLPLLPVQRIPTDAEASPLLKLARLDGSGRLSARAAVRQLGWPAGHRLAIDVADGVLVVAATACGAHVVGSRGDLALPAALRALCRIDVTTTVLVVTYPLHGVVVIHPAASVSRLVHQVHIRMAAGDAG